MHIDSMCPVARTTYVLVALAGFGLSLLMAAPIRGGEAGEPGASPWSAAPNARARLIAGGRQGDALLVGVQIQLDPGWKTYWRTPGDSGLPPAFDWSGSKNLKEARVQWPAPRRFTDASGTFAGYKKEVIFPVLVEPKRAGAPVDLHLMLQYAICSDICVPAEANLKLTVTGADAARRGAVASYLARVPVRLAKPDGIAPAVKSVVPELAGPAPHLIVEAVFQDGASGADLLVEGPDGIYIPSPKKLGEGTGESVRFRVDLGSPKDLADLKGKALVFTVLSDAGQSQTSWQMP